MGAMAVLNRVVIFRFAHCGTFMTSMEQRV